MKKRIIIVGTQMISVGVPAALVGILDKFDYTRYDVTLLLDDLSGEWMDRIPEEVRIKEFKLKRKLPYAWVLWVNPYKGKTSRKLFQVYRKIIRKAFEVFKVSQKKISDYVIRRYTLPEEEYDAVLHFRGDRKFMAEYAVKGIKAEKYVQWIHDERIRNKADVHYDVAAYDKFFCVSASLKAVFDKAYPECANRSEVCYNQVNVDQILDKAKEAVSDDRFAGDYKIVTVGRMVREKGFDLAVEAAKKLKNNGLRFKWFFIGDGVCARQIRAQIEKCGLQEDVIMLGSKPNPLPFVAAADLFVQPSRSEGYCLSLLEARVLCKPIVASELPAFKEQIINEKTGILTPCDAENIAGQIGRVMADKTLAESLSDNLKKEPVDFSSEMDKIYAYLG